MRRIFKYSIPVQNEIEIMMPKGAEILACQVQHGSPWVWALVDEDAPMVPREFRMRGTGHPANELEIEDYIDTFQMQEGRLVFHLFKV